MCLQSKLSTAFQEPGALPNIINRHNYGYTLRKVREIQLNTYEAKLMFHIELPEWNVTFDNRELQCHTMRNISVICATITRLLRVIGDVRVKVQTHIQDSLRRIHEVVIDLPTQSTRTSRGFLTDALAKVTGLASYDQLQGVRDILERIEGGIHHAVEMWGEGSKNLVAAFELQQKRMDNAYRILSAYRKTIRTLQADLVRTSHDRTGNTLFATMYKIWGNSVYEIAEIDNLYTAVQILITGKIPHFLIPHKALTDSLKRVQAHLEVTDPYTTLVHHDHFFYYNQAKFRTFTMSRWLIVIIDAPLTLKALNYPFSLYELTIFPLPTPETIKFYNLLSADFGYLAYSRDSDVILQVSRLNQILTSDLWSVTDSNVIFLDRSEKTCALALIVGDLPEIKKTCGYVIHNGPYPRSVHRLYGNVYLLTNISRLQMLCPVNGSQNTTKETYSIQQVQLVYSFNCHCSYIAADEFRLFTDLTACNNSQNVSTYFDEFYVLNIPYLSEYFTDDQLYNLTADMLLNETIETHLPSLAVADKELDQYFGIEKRAHFDLQTIINRTKADIPVYESLSHYILNSIIKAHTKEGDFDVLNPFTWLTVLGWIISAFALILAVMLRYKVRSLSLLLLARPVRAAPLQAIPKILTWQTATPTAGATVNVMDKWVEHITVLPNLLPIELLILLCLIFLTMFLVVRYFYKRRRQAVVHASLKLQIGDSTQNVVVPVMDLVHPPSCYKFTVNRSEVNLRLVEMNLYGNLFYATGITVYNLPLDFQIPLPDTIKVSLRKIKLLRSLLAGPYYATIQVLNAAAEISELVVLRSYPSVERVIQSAEQRGVLYPTI